MAKIYLSLRIFLNKLYISSILLNIMFNKVHLRNKHSFIILLYFRFLNLLCAKKVNYINGIKFYLYVYIFITDFSHVKSVYQNKKWQKK